jgi:AraC-like DNA-binding protein
LLRFSTEMLPERDRMSAFREEFARQVLNMDVADLSGNKLRIDITLLKLGLVAVGGITATGASEFIREARHVQDGVGDFMLNVVTHGMLHSRQAGREHSRDRGSATLFDYGRPYRCGALIGDRAAGARNIAVPAAMLRALVPHPEDRAGHMVRAGPTLHLLDGYLAALLALDEPPPAELAHRIGLHLVDLVAAVLGPTDEARELIAGRGLKAARLRAILAEIARRCGDPALDIDSIASQEVLSRRSVERLLEETGKSFTEHLTEHRLERAFAMLTDPALSCRRIIDIALAAGFGDISHFNRLFRRRFGETPSSARAGSSAAVED